MGKGGDFRKKYYPTLTAFRKFVRLKDECLYPAILKDEIFNIPDTFTFRAEVQ